MNHGINYILLGYGEKMKKRERACSREKVIVKERLKGKPSILRNNKG